ncbi:MAG: cation diffusion facilitator family transporter [Bacteriovoracaceae bacterium]|jgi:cation diffusion facilitator family transporter|nr:cation-efflux pump [Halobacteriovoraceae bacterium]MDP7321107.1 cation diffusion facilitator family transporter [Bacteriovoracaceae bacterium]
MDTKKLAIKATLIGSVVDFLLGVGKILVGKVFFSQALIVDGIHSLSDLLTDAFVILVTKFSHEAPDKNHPYGHGRFETLGTVVIGVLLMLVACFLAYDNIMRLFTLRIPVVVGWPTIFIAVLSVLSKEVIFRYTFSVGKKIKSKMIIANAWHSRSDAITSALVLVGLGFSYFGYHKVDLFMALVLSGFIAKVGWNFIWDSVKELVDTSLSADKVETIREMIRDIDGVRGLHNLRSRRVGDKAILDVNIEVSPFISVSEGHEIATWVAQTIISKGDNIYDVTVHTDVEDDRVEGAEFLTHEKRLRPLRAEIKLKIESILEADLYNKITKFQVHYVKNDLILDIYFNEDSNDIKEIRRKLSQETLFSQVRCYLELD